MSIKNNLEAFKNLVKDRRGGDLQYAYDSYYPLDSPFMATAIRKYPDHIPFVISIYQLGGSDDSQGKDLVRFTMLVNPNDIQIGGVYVSSSSFTRKGWVPTLWGSQQTTISANGVSPAFFYNGENKPGLTHGSKKDTIGFISVLNLVSLFKNNGANFSRVQEESTMFKSGYSRVINVMDSIKIEYDGSAYLGGFVSFQIEDNAESPFKISYSFEYVVHSIRSDENAIEGHIRGNSYNVNTDVIIGSQGDDISLSEGIEADVEDFLNSPFVDFTSFNASARNDNSFFSRTGNGNVTPTQLTVEQDQLINGVADRLNLDPNQLKDLIWFESKNDIEASNPRSTAIGLIQFTDVAAEDLGYRSSANMIARNRSFEAQVTLMEEYLRLRAPSGGYVSGNQQQLNMAVFYPSYMDSSPTRMFPPRVQESNPNIYTVQDYIDFVNSNSSDRPGPKAEEPETQEEESED